MITRITSEEDFCKVIDDLDEAFAFENEHEGHYFLKHNKDSIKNTFGNKYLLAWDVFVWANKTGQKYDALIIFLNEKSVKFNEPIFSEFLWLSKNPRAGYKLLIEAVQFARKQNFSVITTSLAVKNPKSDKVRRIYEKLGFIKDTETYIAKL